MKPRILIFSIAYEPLIGGAELAVRNITDRLPSFDFDLVTCRFSRKHKSFERIGNVNVYRVGFGSRLGRYLYPVLAFRLAKKFHQERPYQIVWGVMAAYAGAAALMYLRRFPQVKFLLTLQEGDEIVHIHRRVRGFKKQWQKIFRRADCIQAISQYLADWAKAEGATRPIEVVPNGVTFSVFSPLSRGRLRGGRIIKIITTSRLVPKNGIDILIHAMAVIATPSLSRRKQSQNHEIASSQTPRNDVKLLIVGSGPEEVKLKQLAKDLNVEDMVEFVGNVESEKIPDYLSQADIFVRPSRSEGLGSSFLEAMAAGLPVIGTPVGGIPEFLSPFLLLANGAEGESESGSNPNGLFVKADDPKDLAEKIKLLLEDGQLREKLGQNGRKLVEEKYDWEIIAQKMGTLLERLVKA